MKLPHIQKSSQYFIFLSIDDCLVSSSDNSSGIYSRVKFGLIRSMACSENDPPFLAFAVSYKV